jgi:hypothetical protein
MFGTKYQYILFDDPLTQQKAVTDPKLFLENITGKVIFDEIQYVPQILSYIKMDIDKNRNTYGKYILTGSQQFNLIKNLGDSLAGRVGVLSLLPLSYQELTKVKQITGKMITPKNTFIFSCLRGSYPELITHPESNSTDWYGSYLRTYLERDVRTIYNIGNLREFQRFLQLLAARCSQRLNLSSLASDLGVAVNTIKSWISVLEASNIIYLLYPYYQTYGKRIIKNPKVYFLDTGLVCYLTGLNTEKHILNGPMVGSLFENYCIQETVKQFNNAGLQLKLYYLATKNGSEIDLIIEYETKLYPFEIKLTKSPNIEMAWNIEKTVKLFPQLNIEKPELICLTEETISLTQNVNAISIFNYFNKIRSLLQ